MPIISDMEETVLTPLRGVSFAFVRFASEWGQVTLAPSAPPPAIIDDGDGMAHISPDFYADKGNLDSGLLRLIADVFHR